MATPDKKKKLSGNKGNKDRCTPSHWLDSDLPPIAAFQLPPFLFRSSAGHKEEVATAATSALEQPSSPPSPSSSSSSSSLLRKCGDLSVRLRREAPPRAASLSTTTTTTSSLAAASTSTTTRVVWAVEEEEEEEEEEERCEQQSGPSEGHEQQTSRPNTLLESEARHLRSLKRQIVHHAFFRQHTAVRILVWFGLVLSGCVNVLMALCRLDRSSRPRTIWPTASITCSLCGSPWRRRLTAPPKTLPSQHRRRRRRRVKKMIKLKRVRSQRLLRHPRQRKQGLEPSRLLSLCQHQPTLLIRIRASSGRKRVGSRGKD